MKLITSGNPVAPSAFSIFTFFLVQKIPSSIRLHFLSFYIFVRTSEDLVFPYKYHLYLRLETSFLETSLFFRSLICRLNFTSLSQKLGSRDFLQFVDVISIFFSIFRDVNGEDADVSLQALVFFHNEKREFHLTLRPFFPKAYYNGIYVSVCTNVTDTL